MVIQMIMTAGLKSDWTYGVDINYWRRIWTYQWKRQYMVPSKSNRVFNHIWCPPYCWLLTILTLSTHGSRSNSKNSTRPLLWKKPSFSTHDCGSFHFIIICICRNQFDLVHVRGQDRLLKIVSLLLETPLLLSIISLTRHLLPRDYNLYMPQPMNKTRYKNKKRHAQGLTLNVYLLIGSMIHPYLHYGT